MTDTRPTETHVLSAVAEVLRGNPGAYRLIVTEYEKQIRGLALNYLGSREEAEEAVQDIFLKAYRALPTFSLEKRFYPWLYTIALNHLRSCYRKLVLFRSRRGRATAEEPADERTPGQQYEDEERKARLRQAVARLPAKLKEPVILFYFDEESVESVSTVLGIGVENVKSRLFRARKKLKDMLERFET